jgi:Flp pilus assembly pilin Flp
VKAHNQNNNNQPKETMKNQVPIISGYWKTVAICVAGLLAALPPRGALAGQTPLILNISFNVGPIAAQLDITKPVAQPAAGVFSSTLHIHARDDTQTPAFNGDLVAIGQAADADTLLGGFLTAAVIVKQDLLAGMTFQQATADAQTKTGVTVTFLNDVSMAEYALLLALIAISLTIAITNLSPPLRDHFCTIKANLAAGINLLQPQTPPDPCATPTPPPNLIP